MLVGERETVLIDLKTRCAGHNGVRSILSMNGSHEPPSFVRLKIGVGKRSDDGRTAIRPPGEELADFVLSRFDDDDAKLVRDARIDAIACLHDVIERGTEYASNAWNGNATKGGRRMPSANRIEAPAVSLSSASSQAAEQSDSQMNPLKG